MSSEHNCGSNINLVQLRSIEGTVMEVESIKQVLSSIYQPLMGASFQATYIEMKQMPQTGNFRPVLEVNPSDATLPIVEAVSKAVLAKYGETVWKGITGPEDGSYIYYWLWVDPEISPQLEEGYSYNFKILECTPFPCGAGSFSYGVNIAVIIED